MLADNQKGNCHQPLALGNGGVMPTRLPSTRYQGSLTLTEKGIKSQQLEYSSAQPEQII